MRGQRDLPRKRQEFDLCIEAGVRPLPVGATGFMAAELWGHVQKDFARYYPNVDSTFQQEFNQLSDVSKSPDELTAIILKLIDQLQRA